MVLFWCVSQKLKWSQDGLLERFLEAVALPIDKERLDIVMVLPKRFFEKCVHECA